MKYRIGLGSLLLVGPLIAAEVGPLPGGGGEFVFRDDGPHLTDEQRAAIWHEIELNRTRLRAEGRLDLVPRGTHPLLAWPVAAATGLTDPGYHGISGFVDQNPAFPGLLLDYNCGTRTYDTTSGYNHQGVDIFLWPFAWNKMDGSQVEVRAAAPGTIVLRQDGLYDRSCSSNSNFWNALYIQHADGSVAWYGHLKNGSLTPKGVGNSVVTGEYLGVVGSSGNSTGPHLHLEIYDASNHLNDTYAGPCNAMNVESWWSSQRPYYDSALNRVMTGSAPVSFGTCPNPENPHARSAFNRGEPIYFTALYRDQLLSQTSLYRILRPDGSEFFSWTHNSDAQHYAASYWYWFDPAFDPDGPDGIWSFEVTFNGETHRALFALGAAPAGRVPELTLTKVPASRLELDWAPSCLGTEADYEVYEGVLRNWTSHAPVTCSTGGVTTYTLTPAAGSSYYLVVPTSSAFEGSHGLTGSGAERPRGTSTCRLQSVQSCP